MGNLPNLQFIMCSTLCWSSWSHLIIIASLLSKFIFIPDIASKHIRRNFRLMIITSEYQIRVIMLSAYFTCNNPLETILEATP